MRTTAPYWQQLYARDFGDRLHAAASPWRGSRREVGSKTIAAPATSLTLHAASGVDVDGDDGAYVAYADAVRQHRGEVQVGGDLVCIVRIGCSAGELCQLCPDLLARPVSLGTTKTRGGKHWRFTGYSALESPCCL